MRRISFHIDTRKAASPFRISGYVKNEFRALVCTIEQDGYVGRGQGLGIYYLGETPETILSDLEQVHNELVNGASRTDLLQLLPPGGARCAADAALWDIESRLRKKSAWEIAGVKPEPVETMFTIGLEPEPEQMATKVLQHPDLSLFKVKLDADRPIEVLTAIRDSRPDARLVADVNQAWSFKQLERFLPQLQDLGVLMLEQPLARGKDGQLEGFHSPIPLCADESCLSTDEVGQAARRYQVINIKLDKCGGLTHGLEIADAAKRHDMKLMIGSMGHNSLSMAPAHVIAQMCDFVDLDGPLLLDEDIADGLIYENAMVSLPKQRFWGTP